MHDQLSGKIKLKTILGKQLCLRGFRITKSAGSENLSTEILLNKVAACFRPACIELGQERLRDKTRNNRIILQMRKIHNHNKTRSTQGSYSLICQIEIK